jgi:hypothetical protein
MTSRPLVDFGVESSVYGRFLEGLAPADGAALSEEAVRCPKFPVS